MLVIAMGFVGVVACSSEQAAVLSFEAPGLKLDSVRLSTGDKTMAVAYDSTRAVSLTISGFQSGFAELQFGRLKKLVYLEAGKVVEIYYERKQNPLDSPYTFQGDLQPENVWLDEHARLKTVDFRQVKEAEEAIRRIEDSVAVRVAALEEQGFSPSFVELERKRESFVTYRNCRSFRHWDDRLFPFLRRVVQEEPALLICEDYRSFLTESLGALASEVASDMVSFPYAKAQLDYVAGNFQSPACRSFLASAVAISSMNQGMKELDDLMALARPLVALPEERTEMEAVYQTWRRMAPGTAVKDYVFKDIHDCEVRLSDFRGKYVFIDCWATWCGPCRAQMAPLHELMEKYEGKNIVFMGVSSDSDREKWKAFVKEEKLPGIQVNIPSNDPFYEHFAVTGIPRFILIAPDGTVQDAMFPRPSNLKCQKKLDALL